MKTILSYCSARVFSMGLVPMVALGRPQPDVAVNENHAAPSLGLNVDSTKYRRGANSHRFDAAAHEQAGKFIALLVLAVAVVALPLLQELMESEMTVGADRPELIRGSPIAPSLIQPRANG